MKHLNQLIDEYLDGQLDQEAKEEFEQKMAQDDRIQEATTFQKEMREGLQIVAERNFRTRLKATHQQYLKELSSDSSSLEVASKNKRMIFLKIAAVAASIALIILLVFKQVGNDQDLFTQYYEPYSTSLIQLNSSADELLAKANTAYVNKQYQEAFNTLQAYQTQNGNQNAKIAIVAGVSALELGDYSAAHQQFELAKANSLFADKAFWYAALTYLKQEDALNAKKKLNELLQLPASPLKEQAQELLSALE